MGVLLWGRCYGSIVATQPPPVVTGTFLVCGGGSA